MTYMIIYNVNQLAETTLQAGQNVISNVIYFISRQALVLLVNCFGLIIYRLTTLLASKTNKDKLDLK